MIFILSTVLNFNSFAEKQELFTLMCSNLNLKNLNELTGSCLQSLRIVFNLSLEELARRSKLSAELVSSYESGEVAPPSAHLESILWVYGISPIMFMSLVECFRKIACVYLRMVNGKFTGKEAE